MVSIDKPISNISEYLERIRLYVSTDNLPCFFRGESENYEEPFKPSIRRVNVEKEHNIYYHVLTTCAQDFDEHLTYGEILAKMQHYGVPTRLLDVTSNSLVALYFACEGDVSKDGVTYVFYPENEDIKTFESDSVAILASLPRISHKDYIEIYELAMNFCTESDEGNEDELYDFNQNSAVRRLLHEIKKEKPDFEQLQRPRSLLEDVFYIPKQNNARIIRQQGAFLLFGMTFCDLCPFEGNNRPDSGLGFNRITISGNSKKEILSELKMLGVSKSTLFPELYTVAESIKADPKFS